MAIIHLKPGKNLNFIEQNSASFLNYNSFEVFFGSFSRRVFVVLSEVIPSNYLYYQYSYWLL